jgi:DNA polymerase-3 subunit epsilon
MEKEMIGIIDIETTGFLNGNGKIVEVGIAGLDLKNGTVVKLFHSLCRESGMTAKDRNAWIFSNSDLLVEDVREAPDLCMIANEIQSVIDKCSGVTAYNRKFDFDFLKDRGIIIDNGIACPMLLATNVVKAPHKQAWKKGYKWPSVQESWDFFFPNKPYVEQHRGLDDAVHEALIVNELYKLGLYGDEIMEF